jgi:predicted anti-sigma-YlaC factor YlaD
MCREALSARMDGESEPVPAAQTDEHLRSCSECQAWQARAATMSRVLRVREATEIPDLTDAVMRAAPVIDHTRSRLPRLALGVVAVAQLGLALSQAFGFGPIVEHAEHGGVPVASHLFNESTVWNLAVGLGLLWAAFRPHATSGLIVVMAGFVVGLLAYSTHDLITGTAPVIREIGHGLLVVALCLLVVVNRQSRTPAPHGAEAARTDNLRIAGPPAPQRESGRDGRPPLRPAGRHVA